VVVALALAIEVEEEPNLSLIDLLDCGVDPFENKGKCVEDNGEGFNGSKLFLVLVLILILGFLFYFISFDLGVNK
jgi:hypothetical protein